MSERFEYSKNGIFHFENFAEHLEAGTFPIRYLGWWCGTNWYSTLRIDENDLDFYLVIYNDNNNPEVKHSVQVYYNMLNDLNGFVHRFWRNIRNYEDTEKKVLSADNEYFGDRPPLTSISEILNQKNGWLDDGVLLFEYGIQVEAIMKHKIWRFNFEDKLFNSGLEMVQIEKMRKDLRRAGCLYLHRQLLIFHSQVLKDSSLIMMTYKGDRAELSDLSKVLQIVNGVRLKLKVSNLIGVIRTAIKHGMSNVIHYCDLLLVTKNKRKYYKEEETYWINAASELGLRHFLVYLLKPMKSVKDCIDEEDVEKMTNESMKTFIAKFLYEKL
ncbi:unnamed protein product [Caenorhabditis brenneri]